MRLDLIFKIKNDPNLYRFLREHSEYYKLLNRDPENITIVEKKMKEAYSLTTEDKIKKTKERLNLLQTIMEIVNDN